MALHERWHQPIAFADRKHLKPAARVCTLSLAAGQTGLVLAMKTAGVLLRQRCATQRLAQGLGWLLALVLTGETEPAKAWVYPEHRDIAVLAVETLDPERRAQFDGLWRLARMTHEQRLCALDADRAQGLAPPCIDWAALSAVAGDHSCSAEEMSATVIQSEWILAVADVAARLKVDLGRIALSPSPESLAAAPDKIADIRRLVESASTRAARRNALRAADNGLQRADSKYATRAYSSNAHFLLPRPHAGVSAQEYGLLTLLIGSRINALGVYAWYHLDALQQATRLAREPLGAEERQALARAMLFDEAFSLHFLEDAFAAGHVAGTWGDASQRQGTHDYYNEAGLEVFLWRGGNQSIVLMGDAHMRPEDAERAAAAVRTSLEQLLDTAAGRKRATELPYTPGAPTRPDGFNVCQNQVLIARPDLTGTQDAYKQAVVADLGEVLGQTPVPGLGPGLGALPRFRSEIGPFLGLAGSFDGRWIDGGFTPADGHGFVAGVDLSVRVGLGLDGVMRDSGDGLTFLSAGLRGDTSSTNSVSGAASAHAGGNPTAAIPGRTAVSSRVRMPFYLIPGDLLLLSPLYLIAPERYQAIAVTAANGGLIPWQSGFATGFGRFQFVLGRELGVTFYGIAGKDRVLAPGTASGGPARLVAYRSIAFDMPVLEYRVYRSFSSNQSSALLLQLFAAVDVPHSASVVSPPGAPNVDLRDVWSVGIRLVFDWRYYP